jgi:glycosyltransferase involved in cell wall biosynthesis
MKKNLALIVISLDECFSQKGFSGGGHKVTKNLILGLIESDKFEIDIYCNASAVEKIDGINSITVFSKRDNLQDKIKAKKYDYILSSDILLPFANNLIHSNSSQFKSKNGKNKFMQFVLNFYNTKKIKKQEKNLPKDKAVFTVSESLKKDYVSNYNLDENKVFVCYPAVDNNANFVSLFFKDFIVGSMAGGGLNKGGYLLLGALFRLPKTSKLKAKIIFPKIHKAFFFKSMIKLLGLDKRVEVLPKQKDMDEFYKTINCYILPSLNEGFGLVVPEAASNFKPSLVSSTTGVSELIKDSENGFVFDRTKSPVKNLNEKLIQIENMYFNNPEKFIEISKNAYEISEKFDWKKFCDIIIENMVCEG